jgi:hypothetical protein
MASLHIGSTSVLSIAFYDGEYYGDISRQVRICDIEGSVVPTNRPPFDTLEEALKLLELCSEKYSTPHPGDVFTVFIGNKDAVTVEPLARIDVYARDGVASASVLLNAAPRFDTEQVRYAPEDDVVTIALKIISALVRNKE